MFRSSIIRHFAKRPSSCSRRWGWRIRSESDGRNHRRDSYAGDPRLVAPFVPFSLLYFSSSKVNVPVHCLHKATLYRLLLRSANIVLRDADLRLSYHDCGWQERKKKTKVTRDADLQLSRLGLAGYLHMVRRRILTKVSICSGFM